MRVFLLMMLVRVVLLLVACPSGRVLLNLMATTDDLNSVPSTSLPRWPRPLATLLR